MYSEPLDIPPQSMVIESCRTLEQLYRDEHLRMALRRSFETIQHHVKNELKIDRVVLEDHTYADQGIPYKYLNGKTGRDTQINLTPVFNLGKLIHREIMRVGSDPVRETDELTITFLGSTNYTRYNGSAEVTKLTYRVIAPASPGLYKQTFIITDTYSEGDEQLEKSVVTLGVL